MTNQQRRRLAPFLWFFAALSSASIAAANGAFPAVSQIVPDPAEPERVFLRSTFGVVVTADSGENWDLICESAAGYLNIEPPMTVLAGGRVILGLPRGISRSSAAGCEFEMAEGIDANVVDVSRVATEPDRVVALSTTDVDSRLWESTDAGASWRKLGGAFADFRATTLDVAASDTDVIYVSGVQGGAAGGGEGLLFRSDDHGQNWQSFVVPETNSAKRPFIAAVDPRREGTVYVRTTGLPGRLFVTRDGGATLSKALELEVPIQGFALSPDGSTVLATNVYDGSFRADTESLAFEKIACRGPSCLSWTESGLFGCGDNLGDGFIVGSSGDRGRTFTRVLDLSCVRGPLSCDASTIVGQECPMYWPQLRTQLGAETCDPPNVPPYLECFSEGGAGGEATGASGASDGAGGEATGAGGSPAAGDGGSGATPPNAGAPAAGGESGSAAAPEDPSGCSCSLARAGNYSRLLGALGFVLLIAGRRATRSRKRPTARSS